MNDLRLHTRHLLALGGLLEACGIAAEPPDPALVFDTGHLVTQEAQQILELHAALERLSLHA